MSAPFNRRVVRELYRLESVGVLDAKQVHPISERYPVGRVERRRAVRAGSRCSGRLCAGAGAVILATELVNALRLGEAGLALGCGLPPSSRARWRRGAHPDRRRDGARRGFALQGLVTALGDRLLDRLEELARAGRRSLGAAGRARVRAQQPAGVDSRGVLPLHLVRRRDRLRLGLGRVLPRHDVPGAVPRRRGSSRSASRRSRALHPPRTSTSRASGRTSARSSATCRCGSSSVFGYFERARALDGHRGRARRLQRAVGRRLRRVHLGGARLGQAMLRGYGLVFLIINVYTFYFQFVVATRPSSGSCTCSSAAGRWWAWASGSSVTFATTIIRRQPSTRPASGLTTPPPSSASATPRGRTRV